MIPLMMALWVLSLSSVFSYALCKFCVMGSISSLQSWAEAAVMRMANKPKEERMTVIFNEVFCG